MKYLSIYLVLAGTSACWSMQEVPIPLTIEVATLHKTDSEFSKAAALRVAMGYHRMRLKKNLPEDQKEISNNFAKCYQCTDNAHNAPVSRNHVVVVHGIKDAIAWILFEKGDIAPTILKTNDTSQAAEKQFVCCSVFGNETYSEVCAVDNTSTLHRWALANKEKKDYYQYPQKVPGSVTAVTQGAINIEKLFRQYNMGVDFNSEGFTDPVALFYRNKDGHDFVALAWSAVAKNF